MTRADEPPPFLVGTAGWRVAAGVLPGQGSQLQRYARLLPAAEVNSSFYRSHRYATWARWAADTPPVFRFAVKLPRAITHEGRLAGDDRPLARFVAEVGGLGGKLGVLLVQLPPSLAFDEAVAARFFTRLAAALPVPVACEPRHPSWFADRADALLADACIARVAADPAPVPAAARPGGARGFAYLRLHGSPVTYRSAYGAARLANWAEVARNAATRGTVWCVLDNTAEGHALTDACVLADRLAGPGAAVGEGA